MTSRTCQPAATAQRAYTRQLRAFFGRTEVIRYAFVGAGQTASAYLIYAVALILGASFPAASFASMTFSILVGFYSQGRFVFRKLSAGAFVRYLVAWVILYGVAVGTLAIYIKMGTGAYTAGILALPTNVAVAFGLQKWFVFR